jgi:predicted dehydrogenase
MHKDPQHGPRVARRAFLKAAAFAAAPLILPTGAFGRDGLPGANSKLVTGHIGLGARGRYLLDQLREGAAAVCDIDDARLRAGAALTRPGTKTYTDYRELLARKDIDAIVIATPDHWHAVQAIHACEAGKDVYIEVPVCRSPIAGRKLVRAAARFGAIAQSGATAIAAPAHAALLAALKDAGAINEVACWGAPNPTGGAETPAPAPEGLRWAEWLGPAPWRPYAEGFAKEGWRWRLDFGGGQIMRQGVQHFQCVLAALECQLNTSFKVSTTGRAPAGGLYDCPQPFDAVFELETSAAKILWSQTPTEGAPETGVEFRTATGALRAVGIGENLTVDAAVLEKLPEEARTRAADPLGDWRRAIEARERPVATLNHGVLAATLAALANLSYRLGRPLAWDGASGQCINDDIANRMLVEPGAGPWRV